MEGFRPLSTRNRADPRFDTLHEGIPAWLQESVADWLRPFVISYPPLGGVAYDTSWLRNMESRLRLDPPLVWDPAGSTVDQFFARFTRDGEFALDVLDYALRHASGEFGEYAGDERAAELERVLKAERRKNSFVSKVIFGAASVDFVSTQSSAVWWS